MSSSTRSFPTPHSRPLRLLLVEDHVALAKATAEFLRESGLDVEIASSGKSALETVATFRPDVVLCDMCLPDMSGLEVVKAFRAGEDAKNAIVAVLTSMVEADLDLLERNAGDYGVNFFLSKPMTEQKLDRVLRELAEPEAGQESSPSAAAD
jgi:two-component system KDP operon response regulator KdpE